MRERHRRPEHRDTETQRRGGRGEHRGRRTRGVLRTRRRRTSSGGFLRESRAHESLGSGCVLGESCSPSALARARLPQETRSRYARSPSARSPDSRSVTTTSVRVLRSVVIDRQHARLGSWKRDTHESLSGGPARAARPSFRGERPACGSCPRRTSPSTRIKERLSCAGRSPRKPPAEGRRPRVPEHPLRPSAAALSVSSAFSASSAFRPSPVRRSVRASCLLCVLRVPGHRLLTSRELPGVHRAFPDAGGVA